ncbi:MAG TPA: class I SAM-dependent methyltransferase [Pyrinomonadaceae bacterium]|nr:class I SAM-dependent methyltransferase [Pyrinomonadaceae bacterium]
MLSNLAHHLLFKLGWDTRCRNRDVARALRTVLSNGKTLLDAGSGDYGLADFVEAPNVVGTDITAPSRRGKTRLFVRASITSLPFAEASFPVAASVDVIEHLPVEARERAVAELLRVASEAVVIAFPVGPRARRADEEFRESLARRGRQEPDWLDEHLRNNYPTVEWVAAKIREEAEKRARRSDIEVFYSEHLGVTRLLRRTAARSGALYVGLNVAAGLLAPVLPRADEASGYRAVVLARFK